MSFEWSFSGERSFNRCQRQFFIREFVASHSAKDPMRRECFVLKQLKTLDQWHGLLVHRGIEKLVVPHLAANARPDWNQVIDETIKMAERQREFSRTRRYRDANLSKTKAGDDYGALLCHEDNRDLTPEEWDATVGVIELAFRNLAHLDAVWEAIEGVEVHKTFAPGLRLVAEDSDRLVNPRIGSWQELNDRDAILCTTGYPFRFEGTVKPLYLRLVWGELELANVLEDTFAMSQLCWPVPNRCMRLSIDLKLCDDLLRATAGDADEEEAIYGEDEPEMGDEFELGVPFLH